MDKTTIARPTEHEGEGPAAEEGHDLSTLHGTESLRDDPTLVSAEHQKSGAGLGVGVGRLEVGEGPVTTVRAGPPSLGVMVPVKDLPWDTTDRVVFLRGNTLVETLTVGTEDLDRFSEPRYLRT